MIPVSAARHYFVGTASVQGRQPRRGDLNQQKVQRSETLVIVDGYKLQPLTSTSIPRPITFRFPSSTS